MKQKFYYLVILFLSQLMALGQTLDQSNAPTSVGGGGFTVNSTQNVGQSFTAGLTGNLSQINIRLGSFGTSTAGSFQIRIFNGEGYGGTLLNTTVFNVNSFATSNYDEIIVPLSSTPSVVAGNKYTIDLRGITGAASTHGTGGGGATYTSGTFYSNQSPFTFYSLWFKTFVNVPTPASCLKFDGVDDYVNLGTNLSSSLNNTNNLTLEAWVKPTVLNGWNNIICDYNGSTMKYLLRIRNNNNIQFWINGTALNSSFVVPLNTWTHIAAVYNGTTMSVYANGTLLNSQAYTGNFPVSANQTNIGSRVGGTEYFTGNIDDVRVWNYSRTLEQINSSKNCELQGTETGLVGYYKFNQGTDQANNSSITSLIATTGTNGTFSGFALNGATSNFLAGSPVTTDSVIPSAPTITTPVTYNQGATATALTATTGGTGLMWYTAATGGTGSTSAPVPSTATSGSTSYWVSSTNANGCESARVEIIVSVNAAATHLNFDGINDVVNLGTSVSNSLNGSNYLTAEAWINIPNVTGVKTIVGNHVGWGGTQFNLRVINNTLNAFLGDGYYGVSSSAGTIVANTWTHVALVYNDTTLKIYINGNEVGSTNIPINYALANTTPQSFIGNSVFGGEIFNGNMDEVRIWNVALSQSDIQNTMNCELQSGQTGIVAYYKFNQGFENINNSTITTLLDATTNANNGTLANFTLNGSTSNWKGASTITTGNICTVLSNEEFESIDNITVYPNPSNGIFTINAKGTMSISISDMLGKTILQTKIVMGENNIDISHVDTGVYLVNIIDNNNNNQTIKLVKK